jgi:hypothetical protein
LSFGLQNQVDNLRSTGSEQAALLETARVREGVALQEAEVTQSKLDVHLESLRLQQRSQVELKGAQENCTKEVRLFFFFF